MNCVWSFKAYYHTHCVALLAAVHNHRCTTFWQRVLRLPHGNRDNHLKIFKVLLDEDIRRASSPVYNVLDTTVYGRLSTEMGVLLSFNCLITDVTCSGVTDVICHAVYPEFEAIANNALHAFPKECELVAQMGFANAVEHLEEPMGQGLRDRASFSYTEGRCRYVDDQYRGGVEHKIRRAFCQGSV